VTNSLNHNLLHVQFRGILRLFMYLVPSSLCPAHGPARGPYSFSSDYNPPAQPTPGANHWGNVHSVAIYCIFPVSGLTYMATVQPILTSCPP